MRRAILLVTVMVMAAVVAFSGVALAQQTDRGGEQRQPPGSQAEPKNFAPGEVLVKFEPGTPGQAKADAHRQNGGTVKEVIRGIGVEVVGVAVGQEQTAVARYERNPNVEFAELNGVYEAIEDASTNMTPTDDRADEQWGFNNTGQTGGTTDADIDAFEAWDLEIGNGTGTVAVLDTGVKEDHQDLTGKVTARKNFTNSSTVYDRHGHGTHVAGSVGAVTNNGTTGVAGTCPNCSLYNGKVLDDRGSGYYSWIANGIIWAADNDAKAINMSLGGTSYSSTLHDAVNYAWGFNDDGSRYQKSDGSYSDRRVVLVAAAGNSGNDDPHYPSDFKNVISVGATDHKDQKTSWSNYGQNVDVAAPGASILSTTKDGSYATKSGTSMASPHVAGLAGLVWSESGLCGTAADGKPDNSCVRGKVESNVEDPAQRTNVLSGTGPDWSKARINACKALGGTTDSCDGSSSTTPPPDETTAPAAPSGLTASRSGNPSRQSINLAWTDNSNNEENFVVERSTDGQSFTALPQLLAANTTSYSDQDGLSRATTYYYRIKATNSAGSSAYSNTASATTK